MKEEEVRRLVRQQVESIRSDEEGAALPTAYIVCEVLFRMKTMKPWEGMAATESIGRALRTLVEDAIYGRKPAAPEPDDPPGPEVVRTPKVKVKAKVRRRQQQQEHQDHDPPLRKTG